jgi:hypothetical protein
MPTRRDMIRGTLALAILFQLSNESASALVGAEPVETALQQYTVIVGSTKGRCTGVVLEQDVVLTAAHCTQDAQNLWVGGNRGGGLYHPPMRLSPVAEVVQHPGYHAQKSKWPDLALLKLAKPLPDRFIPAHFGGYVPHNGDGVIATGYGRSFAHDPAAGTVLRMVLLRVSSSVPGYLTLVRAGEEAAGGGRGDSGGPVFAYRGLHALVGIIVAGDSNETRAVAIAPYYAWIKDTIEKLGAH